MQIFFPNASIQHPPTSGGDIHRYQLIKNLVELGHEIHTLYPDQSPFTIKHRKMPWPVLRQVRQADVLYCRLNVDSNPATNLTLPVIRSLVPRRTVVVWELNVSLAYPLDRERSPREIQQAVQRLRRAAGRVDVAICVTRQLADEARNLLGIHNAHVLQNGSDPEMFRRDLPAPPGLDVRPDRLNVAFIASGTDIHHDVATICDAAARISRENLPIDIHVFGASEELFPTNTAPSLRHHGPISYLELPNYLAAMDVGLVLYRMRADGLSPLKLFDYLASGCVPVCSESQPMHEVLDGSGAGLIGTWNGSTLCGALIELHRDQQRLERMRTAGRALIVNKYSWRRIAEQTVSLIDDARLRRNPH